MKRIILAAFSVVLLLVPGCETEANLFEQTAAASLPAETAYIPTPTATSEPAVIPEPTATPEPTPYPYPVSVAEGSRGEDVIVLHTRLLKLGYYLSFQKMDTYGDRTAVAVSEFQRQNGLEPTGAADAQTCALLFSDEAAECIDFSELAPTVNMSFAELAGDDGLRKFPEALPTSDTYYIIVDITFQVVMVYTKDANGEYTVPARYMLCSTGRGNRTPRGVFKMNAFRKRFGKFKKYGTYGQYWIRLYGPYFFHSFLYTRANAAAYDEETYLDLGSKASHGCVRLTVPDARWLWYHINRGTRCEIRRGDPNDTATAMIREQLTLAELPAERAVLVAGQIPNTDNWSIGDITIDSQDT
jgi:lipoprotein-anchoring transpeptidase ErfK/SrfK